jgi:O-antigen/teichoic acid export membrane protein
VFRHIIILITLPLAITAIATWIWAEPVVPWLFGESWNEAGRILAAMSGMVLAYSLFELARSYSVAQKLNRLMMAARFVQYLVFGLGCLLIAVDRSAVSLGAVMSAVFIAAAATLLIGLKLSRVR